MASKELTREALVNLATPFFEAGKEIFISLCPTGKLYVGDVPPETCQKCGHPLRRGVSPWRVILLLVFSVLVIGFLGRVLSCYEAGHPRF